MFDMSGKNLPLFKRSVEYGFENTHKLMTVESYLQIMFQNDSKPKPDMVSDESIIHNTRAKN